MGSMNKAIVIGNLGRDAEMRYTQSGQSVATFSVATTEVWNDKSGQRQERTEWHRIVLWGKSAESLEPYLKKGKQVAVEGKMTTRQWEDQNGQTRYTTEIRADRITLLGGGGGGGSREDRPARSQGRPQGRPPRRQRNDDEGFGDALPPAVAGEDDIPFDDE